MKEDEDADLAATRDMLTPSRIPDADGLHKPKGNSGSGHLEVRCPNCHAPTDVAVDTALTDLTCSTCGSHFSLVDQSNATRKAPSLSNLGRFELIERLGIGGFGSVWKARDKELDRTVAIKIPRAGAITATEQEQFFREARAAAQLRHPNIVSVHEVGRDGDSVYIVSDFVRGVTLGDWLTGQQLTSREAAELCAKISDALHHAHEHGVVHRDLKPANIMIDGDGQPHLMDFGLARREVGEVTVTVDGQVLGTPAYMSPEQAQGEAHTADRRSDVYSLGVILFQLLTGELPFRGNARMLMHQVIHDEAPSPRKLNSDIDWDLETITLKCLEKLPDGRYQNAADVAQELGRYLTGEPIQARPISRVRRAVRWVKRHPAFAALMGTVAIVAVIGPVVAIQQAILRHQRDNLLTEKGQALTLLADKNKELQSQLVRNLIERGTAACEAKSLTKAIALYAGAYTIARPDDLLRTSARNLVVAWSANVGWHMSLVHDSRVGAVAFSPDGRTVLTGSWDKTGHLWDAATGKPLGEPMRHSGSVYAVTFSLDGRIVLTGCADGTARLWDAVTGKPLGEPMRHDGPVLAIAFSPDSRSLLTGSADNTARLWDAATGKPVGKTIRHDGHVYAVAFSPDGRLLLTGSADKTARLWDAATGKPLGEPMRHDGPIYAAAFKPDGRAVITGSMDKTARLWDAANGQPLGKPLRHGNTVNAVTFSADGRIALTGSSDNTAQIWNVATGRPLGEPMRHDDTVAAVAISPDSRRVLTGCYDNTARIWNVAPEKSLGEPMRHTSWITAVGFSPDGHLMITAAGDTAQLWDSATSKPLGQPMRHTGRVLAAAFHPDGRTVLTGTGDKDSTARLWDVATRRQVGESMRNGDWIYAVAFSPDGRMVLTGAGKTARLWDPATGKPLGNPMRHDDLVIAVAFSPDGRMVLTGSRDNTARLWDTTTGKPLHEPIRQQGFVRAVAFNHDGRMLLTGSSENVARIWDTTTGKPLGEPMRHDKYVCAVAFSRDGSTVLSGSWDSTARLWDAATGKPLGRPMQHGNNVNAVAFSPDDRLVLTGSSDHTARRWQVPRIPDNPELIRSWAASSTGLEMDGDGKLHHLSQAEWLKARDSFEKIRHELPNLETLSWMERRTNSNDDSSNSNNALSHSNDADARGQ